MVTEAASAETRTTASQQKGKTSYLNKCHGYDTKQTDVDDAVLELWECGGPNHCHYFYEKPEPQWLYHLGSYMYVPSVGWIELKHSSVGGVHGVMVIVVGNGHGDTSSKPGRDWLYFTYL